jgi:hypothetical protein
MRRTRGLNGRTNAAGSADPREKGKPFEVTKRSRAKSQFTLQ